MTLGGTNTEEQSVRRRKDASLVPVEIYGVPIVLDGQRPVTLEKRNSGRQVCSL